MSSYEPSEEDKAAFMLWYGPVKERGLALPPLDPGAPPVDRAEHMRYALAWWLIARDEPRLPPFDAGELDRDLDQLLGDGGEGGE
jgi:hypothetical protein